MLRLVNDQNFGPVSGEFFTGLIRKFSGIKAKLIFMFILLTIIPFVILSVVSYTGYQFGVVAGLPPAIRNGLTGMENSLELLMASVENKMALIAGNATFRENLRQLNDTVLQNSAGQELLPKINDFLRFQVKNDDYIIRVMVLRGKYNSIHCTFAGNDQYRAVINSDWYQKVLAMNGSYLWIGSHPELNTPNDYSLSCLKRITNNGGISNQDILIIDISKPMISGVLSRALYEGGGSTYLIDSNQRIVAETQDHHQTQPVIKANAKRSTLIKRFISGPGFEKLKQAKSLCQVMDFPGERAAKIGYCKINQSSWMLLYIIFKDEYMIALSSFRYLLIFMGILVGVTVISGGLIFSNRLTGSLSQVVTAFHKTETGDLTQKVDVPRQDEIGILARAYNSIVANLTTLVTTIRNTAEKQQIAAETIAAISEQISASIASVLYTVQEISQSAAQQSNETASSSNYMNDLAEKINRVISNIDTIQQIAEDTKNMTFSGITAIEELSQNVTKTTTVTLAINEHLSTLNEETKKVTETISVINEIADRNNLLAMNSIIGAAKAGEAGKGFSVVANNVKKLADKSMTATKEVSDFIADLQQRMAATVGTASNIGNTIGAQNQAFTASIQVFTQINSLANNLTQKLAEIIKLVNNMEVSKTETLGSMENISFKTKQTAAIMNEIYTTIEAQHNTVDNLAIMAQDLLKAAYELNETIKVFKIAPIDVP
jgi:methyl-accepting chemotaxis protein